MKNLYLLGVLVMAFTIIAGCNNQSGKKATDGGKVAKKGGEDDHDHGPGPHDGTIIEFGKWHGEFTVNHKTQEATIYILGSDAKKAVAIPVEKLLLSITNPKFQIDVKAVPQEGDAKGKASRFVGKHENFGKEQEFEGILSGVVEGTPYEGPFKEKEHKHDKK